MDRYLNTLWKKLLESGIYTKFLFFFSLSLLIRLPFFFRDYIDRDESTFILLGQSIVDGHLPYTELWDLKPPLLFFVFAAVIGLFGKSFIAIRLTAVFFVALTGLLTYLIAKHITNRHQLPLIAGVMSIYLASLFGSMQGLMSEHISTFFFILSTYLILRNREPKYLLLTGILFGMALMVKTNLAYSLLLVLIFLGLPQKGKVHWQTGIIGSGAMGFGVILVVVLTFLPYALQGLEKVWLDAVYHAPLAYANTPLGQMLKVLPLGLILAIALFLCWRYKLLDWGSKDVQLLVLLLLGIVFSYFRIGKVNGHYLIQIYPLLLVLLTSVFTSISWQPSPKTGWFVLFLFVLAPMETYKESMDVVRHRISRSTWFNGEGISVPAYLRQHKLQDRPVFFLEYHIGYWLLDQKPPTKAATHPSNICRSEIFPYFNPKRHTGLEEIQYIMKEIKPYIVVVRKNRAIFDKDHEAENTFITNYLERHYKPHGTVDNALVLIRWDRP